MKEILITTALIFAASVAYATVKPAGLFCDNAVLQRGIAVPVWGTADTGEKVTVEFQNQEVSTVTSNGKWMVKLAPMKAGGPFNMTITGSNTIELKNILIGEVWVCSGQSNMGVWLKDDADAQVTVPAADDPSMRMFTVPYATSYTPLADVNSSWQVCNPDGVTSFGAVPYYFGRDLRKALNVPIGLIWSCWGATIAETWTSPDGLSTLPEYAEWIKSENATKPEGTNHPSVVYNGMVHPLIPYGIKGTIWYQGENNTGRAREYRTLFPTLIKSWRDAWGQGDFPFLYVQLAPFNYMYHDYADLREAQLLTLKVSPKTAMAVITDYGDCGDVHPRHKEPVGARLALAARKIAYEQNIVYSGPIYKSMKIKGNAITLYFDHVGGGLIAKGGELKGFVIAGNDQKFVDARASIVGGNKIVVTSPSIADPVAVRFGWADCPDVNFFNKEGLPASPFRTDDWPTDALRR